MFEDFCYILTQFPFSISEKELGYFHQEVNVRVASRVDKRLKLRKIPEMFRINKQVFSRSSKRQIFTVVLQNCEKSAVKCSIKKLLLNFVYLSTIFCTSLYLKKCFLRYQIYKMLAKCKNTSLHESSVFGVFLVRMRENIDQKNSEYRHFYAVFSFKTVRKIEWPFFKKQQQRKSSLWPSQPASICLFKVNDGNTKTMYKLCLE